MTQRLLVPHGAIKIMPPDLPDYWLFASAPQSRSGSLRSQPLRVSPRAQSIHVEIPDGSIFVDAPDLPQPTSWSCALAAASLARLYGVGPDSVEEFMKGMGMKRSGTNPPGIVNYLNKLGLKARIEHDLSDIDLMDLLDDEISTILAIQAWASDPADYDDPQNCDNGHYVAAIGYSFEAPRVVLPGEDLRRTRRRRPATEIPHRPRLQARGRSEARAPRAAGNGIKLAHEKFFFFMDPSILCRYGYMSWTNLDRRWHDNEGTRKQPKVGRHMGIVVDPNGHRPIHNSVAQEIL